MKFTLRNVKRIAAAERFIRRYGVNNLHQLILQFQDGRTLRRIARSMQVSPSCVRRWNLLFGARCYVVHPSVEAVIELREEDSKKRLKSLRARCKKLVRKRRRA